MGIIGSAFVGVNRVFGAGEDRLPLPLGGLVAWYDAADYIGGATWADKSVNGNDLTLSGTYSLDSSTLGGPSLLLNNAYGVTSPITGYNSITDVTHVEIIRPTSLAQSKITWQIRRNSLNGAVNNRANTGTGLIFTNVEGYGVNVGGWSTFDAYSTTNTQLVIRSFESGFNDSGDSLIEWFADSNSTTLTKYISGDFSYTPPQANGVFDFGTSQMLTVDGTSSNGLPGRFAVNMFYNRRLTDVEVQQIYDYYKSTYSLV